MQQAPDPNIWTARKMKGIPAGLGEIYTYQDDQGWHYGFYIAESHCNAQGFTHGGILMTAMDHGLALIIWEATQRAFCSTIHLDNHFINALKPPAFIELRCEITKHGKNLVFAKGELWQGDTLIMQASGVWSVKPRDNSNA